MSSRTKKSTEKWFLIKSQEVNSTSYKQSSFHAKVIIFDVSWMVGIIFSLRMIGKKIILKISWKDFGKVFKTVNAWWYFISDKMRIVFI